MRAEAEAKRVDDLNVQQGEAIEETERAEPIMAANAWRRQTQAGG